MSALIAVARSHAIDVLTDAATTWASNGAVERLAGKQSLIAVPGCVIGATGWAPPCVRFLQLASHRCPNFDALVPTCADLWREVRQEIREEDLLVDYGVVLAGWSARRARLELYSIDSADNQISDDLSVFASGPSDESGTATRAFVARFADTPDTFDAQRDGVALMRDLRRYRRQFEQAARPCVGGYVQRTEVTALGAETAIIHRWPEDRIGQPIPEDA